MYPNMNRRNVTRRRQPVARNSRKHKPVIVQEEPKEKGFFEIIYELFSAEGDSMFPYMVEHFDSLFKNDSKMRHFSIRYEENSYLSDEIDLLNATCLEELHDHILPWITLEKTEGRLFDKQYWRPIRDNYHSSLFYMGYKKMVQYKHYFFQLSITKDCDYDDCKDCMNKDNDWFIHFELVLFGWKDEQHICLQPNNRIQIGSDDMLPERFWIHHL